METTGPSGSARPGRSPGSHRGPENASSNGHCFSEQGLEAPGAKRGSLSLPRFQTCPPPRHRLERLGKDGSCARERSAVPSVKRAAHHRRLSHFTKDGGWRTSPRLPSLKMAPDRFLSLCPGGSRRHPPPHSALTQDGACPPNFRHRPQKTWRLPFSFYGARLLRSSGVASAASPPSTQRWRKRLRPFEFQRSRQSRAQRSRGSGRRRDPRVAAMDSLPGEDLTLPVVFEGR